MRHISTSLRRGIPVALGGVSPAAVEEMGRIRVSTGVAPIACDNVVADLTDAMRAASANSTCVDVALPQSVVLAGREYSRLTLDPNGIVYLRPADSTDQIPSYECPDGFASVLSRANDCILMPYWSMLKPGATGFSVTVKETSDAYLVEYDNVSLDVEKAIEWLKGEVEMPRPKLLAAASFLPYGLVSFQASIPKDGVSVSFSYHDFQYKFMDLVSGAASAIGVRNAGGFGSLIYATCQPQSVGDGYLVEFTLGVGSDPKSTDTDGDGISDWEEEQVGRNPCDPSDGNTSKMPVFFIFGDPSNTHSEMYRVVVSPKVGSGVGTLPAKFELDNSGCGVLNTKFALLERGWSYDVWLEHIGSTFAKGEEDYDYVIGAFASSPKIKIDDPAGLFGCNILVEKTRNFKARGKVAEIHIPLNVKVDVEIDGVEEEKEETAGALVGFIPRVGADRSNPSAEWIKSLRPVVFRCESDDLLPSDELVVTAPAGFLYELKDDEYCQLPQTFAMAYSNLSERTFRLAGDEVSHTALDKGISFSFPLGQVEDVAKFTCFGLKFITSAGDPATTPNSKDEDGQNEFTYVDANQILLLTVKVAVTPKLGDETIVDLRGRFALPEIEGAELKWLDSSPGGETWAGDLFVDGLETTCFYTCPRYEGYPTGNSGFGRKTVRFECHGISLTTDFEVFFPKGGTNHPPCSTCSDCPNWFYYWREGDVCSIPKDAKYKFERGVFGSWCQTNGVLTLSDLAAEIDTNDISVARQFCITNLLFGIENYIGDVCDVTPKSLGIPGRKYRFVTNYVNVVTGHYDVVTNDDGFMVKEMKPYKLQLGGLNVAGIGCVSMVVRHELGHRDIYETLKTMGKKESAYWELLGRCQSQYGYDSIEAACAELCYEMARRDYGDFDGERCLGDGVYDKGERDGYMRVWSMDSETDTYNLGRKISISYSSYGDDEVRVRCHEADNIDGMYDKFKDWADPGCQHEKPFGPFVRKEKE